MYRRNYTVLKGDSLSAIAVKLGLCAKPTKNTLAQWRPCLDVAERIATINGLADVNKINVGQVLVIEMPGDDPNVAKTTAGTGQPTQLSPPELASEFPWAYLGLGVAGVGLLALLLLPGKEREEQSAAPALQGYTPSRFYVSTYCNFAHRVRDGKPINHECIIIPPAALRAEMEGDYTRAQEILSTSPRRYMRRGVRA
jgi:hypothetical protein